MRRKDAGTHHPQRIVSVTDLRPPRTPATIPGLPRTNTPSNGPSPSRVAVLTQIAERYHELVDTLNGPSGIRGDGDALALMPVTYTQTVREFERLMGRMRNQAKQQAYAGHSLGRLRWHILEYHIKAEPVIRREPVIAIKNGKPVHLKDADGKPAYRRSIQPEQYRRHPDAREVKATLGLEWMALNWGLKSEPMLYVDKKAA
jgi:hypothetical protein